MYDPACFEMTGKKNFGLHADIVNGMEHPEVEKEQKSSLSYSGNLLHFYKNL